MTFQWIPDVKMIRVVVFHFSAGIPMLIQSILSAEHRYSSQTLLNQCMRTLLTVAGTELPKDLNITVDLPQFNAINILRYIYRDTHLADVVLPFVEEGVILTINGFSSHSWSIRNACTLLLGTLVPRVLGQQISQQEKFQQKATTAEVFFSRYPKLELYFENSLKDRKDSKKKFENGEYIAPEVIPVLTFLSKLRVDEGQESQR